MISQNKAYGKRICGVENGWISLRIKGKLFHVFLIEGSFGAVFHKF